MQLKIGSTSAAPSALPPFAAAAALPASSTGDDAENNNLPPSSPSSFPETLALDEEALVAIFARKHVVDVMYNLALAALELSRAPASLTLGDFLAGNTPTGLIPGHPGWTLLKMLPDEILTAVFTELRAEPLPATMLQDAAAPGGGGTGGPGKKSSSSRRRRLSVDGGGDVAEQVRTQQVLHGVHQQGLPLPPNVEVQATPYACLHAYSCTIHPSIAHCTQIDQAV